MTTVHTLSALAQAGKLKGQRVFIRADLNVPFDDAGHITEDTRISASVPGIRLALDAGAAVMVTSHLGRPTEGTSRKKTRWRLSPSDSPSCWGCLCRLCKTGWTVSQSRPDK